MANPRKAPRPSKAKKPGSEKPVFYSGFEIFSKLKISAKEMKSKYKIAEIGRTQDGIWYEHPTQGDEAPGLLFIPTRLGTQTEGQWTKGFARVEPEFVYQTDAETPGGEPYW